MLPIRKPRLRSEPSRDMITGEEVYLTDHADLQENDHAIYQDTSPHGFSGSEWVVNVETRFQITREEAKQIASAIGCTSAIQITFLDRDRYGREVLTDVCYNVRKDALVVWQEGLPIYANLGGQIETDEVTLADNAIYL